MTIGLTRKPYNWRLLAILVVAILVSVIMVTPYALTQQADTLKTMHLPMPLAILIPIELLGSTILYGVLAAIGLFAAGKIGLGLPFLESCLAGKPEWERVRKFVLPAIVAGVLAGLAISLLSKYFFYPHLAAEFSRLGLKLPASPPAWQGFLASFYGGVTEEILLRLFALSLFAWLACFVNHTSQGRPGMGALWIANILAAILFGLGHLPAAASMGIPIDAFFVTHAIVLNGLGGLVFGWLYWTFGLEAAMLSHFTGDIVLHVIPSLLGGH